MLSQLMAERLAESKAEKDQALEEALAELRPGEHRTHVRLPSGLKVRLKRPPLSELLGGNPLDPEGVGGDDELMKMLKVTRGS